ncbi:hypothetical protein PaG_01829 [Moesziomyces aphidis]|uniref:Uncharacterized protein n=1 Tax=Moesziomyces aphidis TaxID=84754 RepID=W3VPP4_MOEAP|nr:hypothetical protein PaG_01829 [Moesziomyces aphidis]
MPKPRSGVESEPSTRASAVPPYRRTASRSAGSACSAKPFRGRIPCTDESARTTEDAELDDASLDADRSRSRGTGIENDPAALVGRGMDEPNPERARIQHSRSFSHSTKDSAQRVNGATTHFTLRASTSNLDFLDFLGIGYGTVPSCGQKELRNLTAANLDAHVEFPRSSEGAAMLALAIHQSAPSTGKPAGRHPVSSVIPSGPGRNGHAETQLRTSPSQWRAQAQTLKTRNADFCGTR